MSRRTLLAVLALASVSACTTPLPRTTGNPPRPYKTDGCSGAPDLNVRACCETHDHTYWQGGSCRDRVEADRELRACIASKGHPVVARVYFMAVRIGGVPWLPTSWRWGFGWPYGYGYSESCATPPTASPSPQSASPPPSQ